MKQQPHKLQGLLLAPAPTAYEMQALVLVFEDTQAVLRDLILSCPTCHLTQPLWHKLTYQKSFLPTRERSLPFFNVFDRTGNSHMPGGHSPGSPSHTLQSTEHILSPSSLLHGSHRDRLCSTSHPPLQMLEQGHSSFWLRLAPHQDSCEVLHCCKHQHSPACEQQIHVHDACACSPMERNLLPGLLI